MSAGTMPAAPLVGAVTTRPPAAFSSLTASANRLTQSMMTSGSASRTSPLSLRWRAAALHARLHRVPEHEQPAADLGLRQRDALVREHQRRQGDPVLRAQREQV